MAAHRRVHRLPVVLDHLHVAGLLSEILVDAMNDPDQFDLRRVHALTTISRVLLKAVGAPRRVYLFHQRRGETPSHLPHLLRLTAAPHPELQAALAAGTEPHESLADADTPAVSLSDVPRLAEALLLAPDSTLLPSDGAIPLAEQESGQETPSAAEARPPCDRHINWTDLFMAWRLSREGVSWEEFARTHVSPLASGKHTWNPMSELPLPSDPQVLLQDARQAEELVTRLVAKQAVDRQSTGAPDTQEQEEYFRCVQPAGGEALATVADDPCGTDR